MRAGDRKQGIYKAWPNNNCFSILTSYDLFLDITFVSGFVYNNIRQSFTL